MQQFDIQVAKILSVEEVPNSDKLYKLQVDIGSGEQRQVVAGLKMFFQKDQLQVCAMECSSLLQPGMSDVQHMHRRVVSNRMMHND